MSSIDTLVARLRRRLESRREADRTAAEAMEQAMRARQETGACLRASGETIHREQIRPLVATAARELETTMEDLNLPTGLLTVVRRAHTSTFPARARLSVGIAWSEETGDLWLSGEQTFMPVLLPLDRTTRLAVDPGAPDVAAIQTWVEERLLAFVDACLEIQVGDVYRQEQHQLDPVCGMVVAVADGTLALENAGRRHYFCSRTCRDRFAAEPRMFGGRDPGVDP